MRRTNIYLDEDQLIMLKFLAAEEGQSMADLIRQAVNLLLVKQLKDKNFWETRFIQLLNRVRERIPNNVSLDEIEADITKAKEEVENKRRACSC